MVKKGKVSKKQSKKKVSYDSEESIDDDGSQTGWNSDEDQIFYNDKDEDYDDDEEEGGILLSDLIGLNEAKQKAKIASLSKGSSSKSKQPQVETKKAASAPSPRPPVTFDSEDEDENMESVEEMDNDFASDNEDDAADSEEDDEDIDEEDAESDEDEDGESDEDNSEIDEDEDSEDDARHNKLVNAINRFSNVDEDAQRQKQLQQHYAKLAESSVVGMSGSSGGLGLNALFDHIGDAAGLSAMKTQLKDLDKTSAAPKYVEKVHAARVEREETYAATKEDISKWQETVIANRSVGTLDLAQDKRRPHKAKTLVNSFVPTTDFEKEIQMVMLQHGATDAATEKKERELLEASKFTPEEIAARHAELAKVRALLFYEQMKRHRMNKIKSKAYRAIKRKQRQKLELEAEQMAAEVGDLNSDDEEGNGNAADKAALQRIRERMNLKHKNTSKWARMALKFGHTDKDLRDAYHESVRMGHDLTRKMDEDVGAGDASDDDADGMYDDDDEDNGRDTSNGGKAVARRAKRDLEALLSGDSAHAAAAAAVSGKYKKLFEMDFMKKAVDAQHERAREEAKEVLKELATLEGSELHSRFADESGDDDDHAQTLLSSAPLLTKKQTVTVVKAIGMPVADTAAVAAASTPVVRWTQAPAAPAPTTKSAATAKAAAVAVADASESPADNPWLDDRAAKSGAVRDARVAKKQSQTAAPGAITVSGVVSLQVPAKTSTTAPQSSKAAPTKTKATPATAAAEAPVASQKRKRSDSVSSSSGHVASSTKSHEPSTSNSNNNNSQKTSTATKKQLIEQSQEELVKMAFSGPDYEADFQQQKDQEISRELGLNDKQTKVLRDGTLTMPISLSLSMCSPVSSPSRVCLCSQ